MIWGRATGQLASEQTWQGNAGGPYRCGTSLPTGQLARPLVFGAFRNPPPLPAGMINEFPSVPEGLAIPDIPEALVGDGRVDDRIGDRPVSHEGLQGSGINTAPRKGIPGRVPQHVGMDREWQPGSLAKPLNELLGAVDR